MTQIIGGYKEYIVLERSSVEQIQQRAQELLREYKDAPLSERSTEQRAINMMCEWIKENNIYNKDFQIKK